MRQYGNKSGNSGVIAYEAGPGYIRVRFRDGDTYLYTGQSTGPAEIRQMQALAATGKGLSTYISQHVRGAYAAKEEPEKPGKEPN